MNPRWNALDQAPGHEGFDTPAPSRPGAGCAALAALSPLAARCVLRACSAWTLLSTETQTFLLRRVSSGQDADAARAALAVLMESAEWKGGSYVQKAALERLAAVTSLPTWFAHGLDSSVPH